jgi:D-arabinose 1-dehydrogenase-like Zn-dependent alcohol dehydrogenase
MMTKTEALFVTEKNTVAPGELELPSPGQYEVLVRTAYSCISPGTEMRCLAGNESGSTIYPFIPGYALTGEVST